MKFLLIAIGGLMVVAGGALTGNVYGWFGTASNSGIQAIGGPVIAGLGVALVWATVKGRG